jgi:hypothetical protein
VEAVVVIPVFILLLGGMLFLHHVIRDQQRVMMGAKNTAWTYAMASCRGPSHGASLETFSVLGPDLESTMPGAPGAAIALDLIRPTARASATSTVQATEGTLFSFQQAVSSHAVVSCDNETESGDLLGVLRWLADNAQGVLGGVP